MAPASQTPADTPSTSSASRTPGTSGTLDTSSVSSTPSASSAPSTPSVPSASAAPELSNELPEEIRYALDIGVDFDRLPKHVAVIMDGNGRWAKAKGLPRTAGHKAGVDSLREIITTAVHMGIDVLSCYAFSTENWTRPQEEVQMLMHLFAKTLIHELPLFEQENVRLRFLGDIEALPQKTYEVFQKGLKATEKNTGMVLCLAVNYGSRAEIARAAKLVARGVAEETYTLDEVDPDLISNNLYTAGLPDPELLVRTSGELRLSNFLLFQLAYAELYVTDTYWPDFSRHEFVDAIYSFQKRDRRFGGVES